MFKAPTFLLTACILAACSGNPFDSTEDAAPPTVEPTPPAGTDNGTGIDGGALPPNTGTTNPTPDNSIFRVEARGSDDGADMFNGYATGFRYDADTDTFYVEGLAFDGNQPEGTPYQRNSIDLQPGPRPINSPLPARFGAYEGPETFPDPLTNVAIDQFSHRAVYGKSLSGLTEFAIVRTGSYTEYGFGGYIFQRNGNVVLPSSGQAIYNGDYAGLRDFNGVSGIEYVTGDMDISIDINGFSGSCSTDRCSDAVSGTVTNRRIFDRSGNNITQDVIDDINREEDATLSGLPTLIFRVGPGVMDRNGEINGTLNSNFRNREGRQVQYEEGNYYAIMAGDHTAGSGGEIVGIIVVEGDNRSVPGTTFRETGGFIATRQQPVGP